jgi:hypothetical protein
LKIRLRVRFGDEMEIDCFDYEDQTKADHAKYDADRYSFECRRRKAECLPVANAIEIRAEQPYKAACKIHYASNVYAKDGFIVGLE